MSTLRKTAFVFSILLCCLPIIIFLWILPCSSSNTCPIKIINWEHQQDDIELKGRINTVYSLFKNSHNLALMYKGNINSTQSYKHGIVSFVSTTGATAWFVEQETEPYELDCSVVDINSNDIDDCLVLDENGLKAIETISGRVTWHVHSFDERKTINELTMAVRLTDFNDDKINEILTIYKGNNFLIVCGSTGKALVNIKMDLCQKMTNLRTVEKQVQFACQNDTQTENFQLTIEQIHSKYKNSHFQLNPMPVLGDNTEKTYTVANRKLMLENNDKCPQCRSIITLYDNTDNVVKVWPFYNSYIMKPVPFSFQNTKENIDSLKGHVNGFIIKIWQWMDKGKHTKRSVLNRTDSTYNILNINERLMLIMFNNTDVHVINASLTEINQLCINGQDTCQPDHKNQDDSVLIDDLDRDGSQELVSYYSSYMLHSDQWHLTSYFKVFRLENELPKLYGAT